MGPTVPEKYACVNHRRKWTHNWRWNHFRRRRSSN
jgi:hypothetical protein